MRERTLGLLLTVVWWSVVLGLGCTGQDDAGYGQGSGGTGAAPAAPVDGCVPGITVPCICPNGLQGVTICHNDGSGYSECMCPESGDGADLSMGDSWQQQQPIGGEGGASAEAGAGGAAGAAGAAGGVEDAGDEITVMDGGGIDDGGGSIIADSGTVTPNPDQDEVPATAYCAPASNWDPGWTAWEEEVLQLVNERRAAGANCGSEGTFGPAEPLTMSPELRCSARLHSKDMAENNYFDHTSLDGRDPFDRMADAGYSGGSGGENIASGQMSPQDVMSGWMGSDGHCANIMRANYTEIGIGYYEVAGSGGGWWDGSSRLWTQNFGGPGWGGW